MRVALRGMQSGPACGQVGKKQRGRGGIVSGPQVISIWVRGGDGSRSRVQVAAGPTPVPGLVVNEDPEWPGTWNITHAATGSAVAAKFPGPEHALYVAGKLAGVCDWTMTGPELAVMRGDLSRQMWRVLEEAGALEFWPQRHVIPDGCLGGAA